tara:strand:+ start:113 stop:898 length:786 start_codon:yes stop_codon:yes gene_type:complete
MPKVLLVDADMLAYRISSALEIPVDWGNDEWSLHSDFKEAKRLYDYQTKNYLEFTETDRAIHCFTDGKQNFRKIFDKDYKAHRKTVRKPVCYKPLKDYVMQTHDSELYPMLEGDDVIGILATGDYKDRCVILSGDKDMKTIPAIHCDFDENIDIVPKHMADYNFMVQVLVGDIADGYKGCPSVGQVKASRLLNPTNNFEDNWDIVINEYIKQGLTVDDAYRQATLARILHNDEYDLQNGVVKQWSYKYGHYKDITKRTGTS